MEESHKVIYDYNKKEENLSTRIEENGVDMSSLLEFLLTGRTKPSKLEQEK